MRPFTVLVEPRNQTRALPDVVFSVPTAPVFIKVFLVYHIFSCLSIEPGIFRRPAHRMSGSMIFRRPNMDDILQTAGDVDDFIFAGTDYSVSQR